MGHPSLLKRIFVINLAVFGLAVLVLALTPATVSADIARLEAVVLVALLAITAAVDFLLLRRALAPLRRLATEMETVEPLHPGRHLRADEPYEEIGRLTAAFDGMSQRLADERRRSVERSLTAQEAERLRVAQELHDGIGQSLTALMLQIDRAARGAPEPLQSELAAAREAARALLGEVRDVAIRLRPEALDDLGLTNALQALCVRVGEQSGLPVALDVDPKLPALSPEAELVIFRIAQEALTNTLRHARASRAELTLNDDGDGVVTLLVRDAVKALAVVGHGARRRSSRATWIPVRRGIVTSRTARSMSALVPSSSASSPSPASATTSRSGTDSSTSRMHDNERYLFEALRAGASGYVLKSVVDRDLVEACRAVMRGESFLYPAAVSTLIREFVRRAEGGEELPADPLTPRESEIVKLVAEGNTSREIAELLVISEKTVDRHRANILEKLGMRDRVDLTRYAIRSGLVEP